MPRLNLYEMANPFRSPRASGAEMGAAPAQALGEMGDAAFAIGERIQKREENAISDQAFGEVNTQALPLLNDFEKKHDIALPQALNEFQGAMQKIKADAMRKANLRPEARAALERQLDNQITQYSKSAIGMRIKAGNDAMVARLNEQFDTGVNQVGAAPSIMKDVIETNRQFVESRKDSMDPLTYQAAMRKAHAGPIQAAVNAYLAQELPDKADELLQDPKINSLIDPDALRPLRINVAVEKGKREKDRYERETNRKAMSSFFGYEISQDQADQNPGFMKMPAIQKMNVWKMQNPGKEMSNDMALRALDLDKRDSQDKSMRVAENMQNWEALSPQDKIWTRLELASKFPPVRITDPLTNEVTYAPNPAAGYAERQIMGLSSSMVRPPSSGGASGQGGDMQVDPAVQAERDVERRRMVQSELTRFQGELEQATASGDTAKAASVKQNVDALTRELGRMGSESSGAPTGSANRDEYSSLYTMVPELTGPGSRVMSIAEGLPLGIGNKINQGWKGPIDDLSYEGTKGRYEKANRTALMIQNDIVDGLRGADEKIANQYREELKKIVTIDPQVFNSDMKLWTTFQTIEKNLLEKKKHFEQIRDGKKPAGPDERRGAAYAINAIDNVILRIDVPKVKVNSPEEFEKLKLGTIFITSTDPRPRRK